MIFISPLHKVLAWILIMIGLLYICVPLIVYDPYDHTYWIYALIGFLFIVVGIIRFKLFSTAKYVFYNKIYKLTVQDFEKDFYKKVTLDQLTVPGITILGAALSAQREDLAFSLIHKSGLGSLRRGKNCDIANMACFILYLGKYADSPLKALFLEAMDLNDFIMGKNMTPLMWASLYGPIDSVKFLLDQNVDVTLKNRDGKTARDLALAEGYTDVVALLDEYSGK